MEVTEDMKRMARRIWASQCVGDVSGVLNGYLDDAQPMKLVLAAIMETSELAAKYAGWAHMVPPDGGSPTAEETQLAASIASGIRSGEHYALAGAERNG